MIEKKNTCKIYFVTSQTDHDQTYCLVVREKHKVLVAEAPSTLKKTRRI